MANILICDDEKDIVNALKIYLSDPEYTLFEAYNGQEALEIMEREHIDLVISDVMMPRMDGLELTAALRGAKIDLPVLIITAKGQMEDMERGFRAGTDDYMVKPFSYEELDARLRALIRRGPALHGNVLTVADLSLETSTRRVWRGGKEIRLSGREFALLEYMMYNEGIVLTRGQIGQHIWNSQGANASNVVDVYIRYLRRKIDDESKVKLIRTVRGAGYRLSAEE